MCFCLWHLRTKPNFHIHCNYFADTKGQCARLFENIDLLFSFPLDSFLSVSEVPSGTASGTTAAFCCPPYENRLLSGGRPELNAALGVYGSTYAAAAAAATHNYANYFSYGAADASALYSSLNPQCDLKDGSGGLHAGITQSAAYHPYDPPMGHYHYDR
uniref:Uncharacterized protein n=1 Tax=Erpetoichthys calabaricus TaxID=27687 RepID=A0A8C4XC67_ERPCA